MADTAHVEETPQTGFTIAPIGASQKDLELQLRLNAEMFKLTCPEVEYFKLNRTETKVDDLYGESVGLPVHDGVPKYDGSTTGSSVRVPVKFYHGEQQKILKKYGVEEEHEAVCFFDNRTNMSLGIEPRSGDLVEYLAVRYEIINVKMTDYFGNTQVALNLVATLKQIPRR